MLSHLFSPLEVGNLTLRNRIGLAPMSFTTQAPGGGYSEECISFAEAVAKGGAGLVTLGEVNIGVSSGKTHDSIIMLGDPKTHRSLFKIAEAVHRHGAAISVEISHGGAMAPPSMNGGKPSLAPCATADPAVRRFDTGAPLSLSDLTPMTEADMLRVAEEYADSVELLANAGFDMVQIHMGHGWLLHQFLSPLFNKRTDEYGGALENRVRFPLMVLDHIRARVGAGFPLDARVSGDDVVSAGQRVEVVTQQIALMQDRLSMVNISCGGIFDHHAIGRMSPSVFLDRGCNVHLAEYVRNSGLVHIPVSTVGGLCAPEELEKIISEGRADLVFMGRALIADHDLPNKARRGEHPLRCLRCNICQEGLFQGKQRVMRCSVNPTVGFEACPPDADTPAKRSKTVLIAGAGPAGMTAAVTAAKRGHKVVLCEKSNKLGGNLEFSDHIDFKYDIRVFKDDLISEVLSSENIDVRLGVCVSPDLVNELKPDSVIAAIGAAPAIPHIPGIDGDNVISATDVYSQKERLTGNIVILGGGLTGAETAVFLADLGLNVVVIEKTGSFASQATQGHLAGLKNHIEGMSNLRVELDTSCLEITGAGAVCEKGGVKITFPADHIIVALGMAAKTSEAYLLDSGDTPEFRAAGDCEKIGKIREAVSGGFWAAYDL